jgi:hypothetical protein
VCGLLAERSWRDPKQAVEDYRRNLRRSAAYEAAIAKHERSGLTVFCDDNPRFRHRRSGSPTSASPSTTRMRASRATP